MTLAANGDQPDALLRYDRKLKREHNFMHNRKLYLISMFTCKTYAI